MESLIEVRRAGFEAAISDAWDKSGRVDDEGDYVYRETWVQGAWIGYNSALDSVVVELPEVPKTLSASPTGVLLDKERLVAILDCRDAIHAAGVRTK